MEKDNLSGIGNDGKCIKLRKRKMETFVLHYWPLLKWYEKGTELYGCAMNYAHILEVI